MGSLMKQVFLLGSSNVYGVGSPTGGWAEMVKRDFHELMYGEKGVGQKFEVFNFGKSGATIRFVLESFPQQLIDYGRGGDIAAVVSVGGNNAKAQNKPDNFVSTPEDYAREMKETMIMLKRSCGKVLVVAGGFYDESKTNPIYSPFNRENKSYFTNERRKLFQSALNTVCSELNVEVVEVGIGVEEWVKDFVYEDGLHPNERGYRLIADKVRDSLWEYFGAEKRMR